MPAGGPIQVHASLENDHVVVAFADEGDGIPEDVIDKIWDPFFTTKEKGTGLGLGIVKNIIQVHEGEIDIQNRSLQGSRIVVRLPVQGGLS